MGERIRRHDWAATPLGPMESWPQSLKTALAIVLTLNEPAALAWGPELVILYNDAYARLFGPGNVATLGMPVRLARPELWETIGPEFERILRGGEAERHEGRLVPVMRHGRLEEVYWTYSHNPVPDADAPNGVGGVLILAVETSQTVAAMRASDEREAFLLKLSDALRPLVDPIEIMSIVSEEVGRHLGAGRCGYAEVAEPGDYLVVARDWTDGAMESLQGKWLLDSFGEEFISQYRSGKTLVVDDLLKDARTRGVEAAFEAVGNLRSSIGVPLIKQGKLVALFYVQQTTPRHWTKSEVELVEAIAERTWSEVERASAEAALHRSEARFRSALEIDTVGVIFWGPDFTIVDANDAFLAMSGFTRDEAIGKSWRDFTPDEFVAASEKVIADLDNTGRMTPYEKQYFHKNGGRWWGLFAARRLEDGDVVEYVLDVTARKRTEEALRQSDDRLRQFGDASSDVLWMRDPETMRWTYLTRAFEDIYGLSRDEALAGDNFANWVDLIFPEDRPRALDNIARVRNGESVQFEYRIRRPVDGGVRWLRDTDFPMFNEHGEVVMFGGIGRDVTAIKRADEHQRTLLAELQHRVRNTLAVVRSIVRRTAENSGSVEEMLAHFQGRLDAFSRVQAAITRAPSETIDLKSLIEDELVAHAAHDGGQVRLDGSDVQLDPKTAERLSLAIHELTTNAVKHGALTHEGGRVRIRWRKEALDGGEKLLLDWSESGIEIDRDGIEEDGFGMELLRRVLPYDLQAETKAEFRPDGLHFSLAMPISEQN
jgi:PAS domain S-box-containing protein